MKALDIQARCVTSKQDVTDALNSLCHLKQAGFLLAVW